MPLSAARSNESRTLRFLRGRGQFVDDLAREDLLHAVILRSAVAHGRIRSIDAAAARARPGVHAVITAADLGAAIPTIPLRQESSPAFEPFEQPVIAHGKVRYVGEPVAVVLAESAAAAEDALEAIALDIEALPAVVDSAAAGDEPGAPVRGRRQQSRAHPHRPARRRGRGVRARAVRPPRALRGAAPRRRADGAARAAGGVGRRPAHGVRRRQGRLSQPARAGEADGPARKRDPHGGKRRRRRLRRARRILPRGFPDPVRRPPDRTPGEVDRGPSRASHRHQSCPRRRLRAGDRLRGRRHDPRAARTRVHRPRRLYPHQRADRRAQYRAGPHRALSHSARAHRRLPDDDQQDAGRGPIAGRGATRPTSFASGCSTSRRASSVSTASRSAGAT